MRYLGMLFGVLLLIACAVAPLRAAASKEEAVSLVQSAVAFYKANGLEKALDEFSKPTGQFNKGELYVFVYDLNATLLAHPNPKLVGQNMLDLPDVTGKNFYRREIREKATKDGKGWADYKYQNPKSKEVENKTTYFEKVDDIIVCCGVYR